MSPATRPAADVRRVDDGRVLIAVGGWSEIVPAEALAGFTTGAAYAMKLDGKVGRLAPGQWADFVVLGGDPMAPGSEESIWQIHVRETWVAGERVFAAQ